MIRKKLKTVILILIIISFDSCDDNQPKTSTPVGISFIKHPTPVWEGVWTAADPSVVRDGDTLRMYYSSLILEPNEKLIIAGAKSIDGIHWTPSNNILNQESIALDNNINQWDNHLEAVSVLRIDNELWMYYCGYPEESDISGTIVATAQIGLAKSQDNINFTRFSSDPILQLGAATQKDGNALFSPTVIEEGGMFYMFYVGYCIENCAPPFLGILGATSQDGENWTKLNDPIISGENENLNWAEVIKEPSIFKGPDNVFYLFISGDESIGVARSNTILGPYEVYPEPILTISEDWETNSVIAPSIIIEDNRVRMWYMGVQTNGAAADFKIGYAESEFPFTW